MGNMIEPINYGVSIAISVLVDPPYTLTATLNGVGWPGIAMSYNANTITLTAIPSDYKVTSAGTPMPGWWVGQGFIENRLDLFYTNSTDNSRVNFYQLPLPVTLDVRSGKVVRYANIYVSAVMRLSSLKSSSLPKTLNFDYTYVTEKQAFNNSVRSDNSGTLTYDDKDLVIIQGKLKDRYLTLSDVETETITGLSNDAGQYYLVVTLSNDGSGVKLKPTTILCPYITSISLDDYGIIINSSIDIPSISNIQNITKSSLTVPSVKFDVTYPTANTAYLLPSLPNKPTLATLVQPKTNMEVAFLILGLATN